MGCFKLPYYFDLDRKKNVCFSKGGIPENFLSGSRKCNKAYHYYHTDTGTALNNEHRNIQIERSENGKLSYTGEVRTEAEKAIVAAIDDTDVTVVLDTDHKTTQFTSNGNDGFERGTYSVPVVGGKWLGARESKLGGTVATQAVNIDTATKMEEGGLSTVGETVTQELLEGYETGLQGKGAKYSTAHRKVNLKHPPSSLITIEINSSSGAVYVKPISKPSDIETIDNARKVKVGRIR